MHTYLVAGATILASVAGTASAKGLSFKGFPDTGTYQDVASFDLTANPKCSFQPHTYTGASSPLDEEVRRHIAHLRSWSRADAECNT